MILTTPATLILAQAPAPLAPAPYKTIDITFRSQDGQEFFGKLTMPEGAPSDGCKEMSAYIKRQTTR